jgi:hypothetical protein
MNLISIVKIAAAALTILSGLWRLVEPKKSMGFTGLKAATPRGVTELRAVPGGMFIGLGIAALIFPTPAVYKALAITYAVMAVIRIVSIAADKSLDKPNGINLAFDTIMAIVLFL